MPKAHPILGLFGLLLILGPAAAPAREWALSAGVFGTESKDERVFEMGLEVRFAPFTLWGQPIRPIAGLSGTEQEAFWVYGGFRYEIDLGSSWRIAPYVGASYYEEGDGKDLGGEVEFRSGLEISRRIGEGSRLGLSFYHLSNAGLYDRNPGVESLVLVWSFGGR